MKIKKFIGPLILLITSVVWGLCFVAQTAGMDHVGPFTFHSTRSFLGADATGAGAGAGLG